MTRRRLEWFVKAKVGQLDEAMVNEMKEIGMAENQWAKTLGEVGEDVLAEIKHLEARLNEALKMLAVL